MRQHTGRSGALLQKNEMCKLGNQCPTYPLSAHLTIEIRSYEEKELVRNQDLTIQRLTILYFPCRTTL